MADPTHGLELEGDDNRKKSRKGAIPRNVATYLKSATLEGFADEMAKLSKDEKPTSLKVKHLGQSALLGGVAAPLLSATGDVTKGLVNHGLPGGAKALKGISRGDIAAAAVTGALGATALSAAKQRLAKHQDVKIADAFGVGAGGAPSGPKVSTPSAPTLGVLRGSSNKGQRVGNTPIAAKSGVVRSMSGQAMNPRSPLGDAIRPKV